MGGFFFDSSAPRFGLAGLALWSNIVQRGMK